MSNTANGQWTRKVVMMKTPSTSRIRLWTGVVAPCLLLLTTLASATAAQSGPSLTLTSKVTPTTLEASPGEAISITNLDTDRHRLRSTDGPEDFDTGDIGPGETATITLSTPGTYPFYDHRNDTELSYQGSITIGGPATGGGGNGGTQGTSVSVLDRSFSPAVLSVAVGATVTFTNTSGRDHTVTADDFSFDSGIFGSGSYTRTFDQAGTFSYFCVIHPEMRGSVTVGDTAGTGSPPAPPLPTDSGQSPDNTSGDSTTPGAAPSQGSPADPAAGATTSQPTMLDYRFSPASLTGRVGDTITWRNDGQAPHTATARDGSFDTGFVMSGGTGSITLTTPGTFAYYCTLHPEMTGEITVAPAGDPIPAPPGASPAVSAPGASPSVPAADDAQTPAPSPAATSRTSGRLMLDNRFSPASLTGRVGDTITWRNDGQVPHTATARDGSFDTGFVMSGETGSITPTTPGTFSFYCTIHPEMTGTITVTAASTGAGTGTAEDTADLTDATGEPPGTDSSTTPLVEGEQVERPEAVFAEVIDNAYDPDPLVVTVGTPVTFLWTGALPHTVTDRAGEFDSGILKTGDNWSYTFATPGRYEIYCTLHADMVGVVTVEEAAELVASSGQSEELASAPITGRPSSRSTNHGQEMFAVALFLAATGFLLTALIWLLSRGRTAPTGSD